MEESLTCSFLNCKVSVVPPGAVPFRFAAAAAKLLQSCPTLRDPMDWSIPASSIYGIFQARVLEWVAIAFSPFRSNFRKLIRGYSTHISL